MNRTHTVEDWRDTIFTASELLSLSANELVQLEEISGDTALTATWWRRRRRRQRAV
jgi:hypothetical protein